MTDGTTQYEATPMVWPKPVIPGSAKLRTTKEVQAAFAKSVLSHLVLVTTDSEYRSLTRADWQRVLAATHTNALRYVDGLMVCTSYAFLMRGLVPAMSLVNGIAAVLSYDTHHAWNAVLVEEADGTLSVAMAEPQTDQFIDTGAHEAAVYKAGRGQVIF